MTDPDSRASADLDLLLGILAYQLDFVSRDQLLSAARQWSKDRSKSFDVLLIELEILTPSLRDLLLPLVKQHVADHNDDPANSLKALSSIDSLADDLRRLGDDRIDATLSRVGGDATDAHATVDTGSKTETESRGDASSTGHRFHILRPHARGGLGKVSIAKDVELNRDVALKEIQPRYANDHSSRSRFLLEAEVTGGLEHPGIVPVYGLGRYQDGRPFYAMRFIKGDSLQQAAHRFHHPTDNRSKEVDSVEFRKLLSRFIDVCHAIEYAHSRGVLHRDLKPGNIMLGKYGETLVVDWGLAKTARAADATEPPDDAAEEPLIPQSGSNAEPTAMGNIVGTPAYMSPEQARGELDALGQTSDVYSLGATLYYVLTGCAPFASKDPREILENVKTGTFPLPRERFPKTPRPLQAICLKAMATERSARYQSPRELSNEIERWLADEPVLAYPEPFVARAARWIRNHQSQVAALVFVVLMSVVGLAAFGWYAEQSRRQIAQEKSKTELARHRAEDNFQNALGAVEIMLTRVGDERLATVPMMGEVRREILQDALDFYMKAFGRDSQRPEVIVQTARGYRLLGSCHMQVGNYADARDYFGKARGILDELDPATARTYAARYESAILHSGMGELCKFESKVEESITAFRKSADEYQSLDQTEGENRVATLDQIFVLGRLAFSHKNKSEYDTSDSYFVQQKAMIDRLRADLPQDDDKLLNYMQSNAHNQALLRKAQVRFGEAIELLEYAREIQERLLQVSDPAPPWYRQDYANTSMHLGGALSMVRSSARAEEMLTSAIEEYESLRDDFPSVRTYPVTLAASYDSLADVCMANLRLEEAREWYSKSIQTLEGDGEQNLEPFVKSDLANSYRGLAEVYKRTEKLDEAEAVTKRCTEIYQALAEEHPDIVFYQTNRAADLHNLAMIQSTQGKFEQAEEGFRSAIKSNVDTIEKFGATNNLLRDQANSWSCLASVLEKRNEVDEADHAFQKAKEVFGAVRGDAPFVIATRATVYHNHAMFLLKQDRTDEAIDSYLGSIEQLEPLVATNNPIPAVLRDLANSCDQLGTVYLRNGDAELAEPLFQRSENIWENLSRIIAGEPSIEYALQITRIRHLISMGDLSNAESAAKEWVGKNPQDPTVAYDAACMVSLCLHQLQMSQPDSPQEAVDRLRNEVMKLLQGMQNAPPSLMSQVESDPDFASMRDHPPFQELLKSIRDHAENP